MTVYVILVFLCILIGMAISVSAFGTGGKRANIIKDIYFSVEEVDGIGILYSKTGDYSAIIEIHNPVQKYSAETDSYYNYSHLFTNICQALGEGYIIQKQDVFVRKSFDAKEHMGSDRRNSFLSDAYFRFFDGREYTESSTYLCIIQENRKNKFLSYDDKKWRDFMMKLHKVEDILVDAGVKNRFLGETEAEEYVDRYFSMNFRDRNVSMTDFKVDNENIWMGDRQCRVFSLVDVDNICLPSTIRPFTEMTVNNSVMPVDLVSEIDKIPGIESVVYNQIIFLPNQKRELNALEKKKNRHSSIPSPSNQLAVEDIKNVQNIIAREGKQLVYAHFNFVVCISKDADMAKVTNYLENMFSKLSILISKRAYNQLELFVSSFPGNCSQLNPDYDRFLTLSDAAMCLMYKERQCMSETTPIKFYYTDRQGVPMALDLTGKEGKVRLTDNSNFFTLGPSGSGKSFFMNTVMYQFYEQITDVVIVDTGHSYEGLCNLYGGVYLTYSKEHPISMNPFKITTDEYNLNFDEKKTFIMNLVFLIFIGNEKPTMIQETLINKVILEYYEEYFHPFKGYTNKEREELRERLKLEDKKNGTYDKYQQEQREAFRKEQEARMDESEPVEEESVSEELSDRQQYDKIVRKTTKLYNLANDPSASEGERTAASNLAKRMMPEVMKDHYPMIIEERIDRMEERRKNLHVTELSFNSFYEFSLERIPQLMEEMNLDKNKFDIDDYGAILSTFYRGGAYEETLNNDMASSLFDERFIVFELDQLMENKRLAPIIVLIIMDVFTQKMRIKKGRKVLVIEEAWKAIATPTMASYIQYLYKTARKHWASVGVVTQEIQDITGNETVKDAIISNSGVFFLCDQSKFKEKFTDIRETLALTDTDVKQIFTINKLENKENRSQFNEVFIKRGSEGIVVGVEVPHELYMTFTTEKIEKEALKMYLRELGCSYKDAVIAYCRDWELSGISKPIEFAQKVKNAGRVLSLSSHDRRYYSSAS